MKRLRLAIMMVIFMLIIMVIIMVGLSKGACADNIFEEERLDLILEFNIQRNVYNDLLELWKGVTPELKPAITEQIKHRGDELIRLNNLIKQLNETQILELIDVIFIIIVHKLKE